MYLGQAHPNLESSKAVGAITRLIEDLNLPTNLRSMGVKEGDLPEIAKKACRPLKSVTILEKQPTRICWR
ncbi:iron-containing alcohol dehydrogenase [Candidatus Aerophobetes bacterium]|uniref:Iron-containing alcohol dehydrogenase n=1 Tax=Aerophobetes bacterium TaxID=2030807 RepID=A0A523TKU4_UNCAE|nr:MAG: iron-containing alcohol dehydrogenase [Candidatus Aerophobetes bacterium]